jgi:pimeloyl-ACP methyl ester carboxylesterase
MATVRANDVGLFYELAGEGDPLVLVHGSWSDHHSWQSVVPGLSESFRVLTYDRRGHSQSDRPSAQGSRREDEDDLASLMEALDLSPAHLAGNSFGASIVLGLASRYPELFRSLIVHEPPLMSVVADDRELQLLMKEFQAKIDSVLAQLQAGDSPGAARRFVEEVALGPGIWEQLPEEIRTTFINNASTFLDEQRDPHWASLDISSLSKFSGSALLTQGDQSPPWFPRIIEKLGAALDQAEARTFRGAGHIPHLTHADDYVKAVTAFVKGSR